MPKVIRRYLIGSLAAGAVLGVLAAPGAAHAASRPAPETQRPTAAPVVTPVPGAPARALPVATQADFAAQPPVPSTPVVGAAEPSRSAGISPAHIAKLPAPSAPALTPLTGVSSTFAGLSQGTKGPPSDSNAAGGPSNVLEQVNGAVAVYSRTGALQQGPFTSASWYGVPSSDLQFDPHTVYDPAGAKFITMMEDGTTNSWMVSVTSTSDATSSRCTYTFSALASGATSVDFPLMGLSDAYLILTIRELGINGNRLYLVPLAQVEACQAVGGWVWTNVQHGSGRGTADTLTPVIDYDIFHANSYLISSYGGGGSNVTLYKINDSGSPVLTFIDVAVPSYSDIQNVPQKGSSVKVEGGNSAITQAVSYTNGMYATLTSSTSGVDAILWMEFNPDAQTLTTDGLFWSTGLWYFDSSITEGSNGSAMYTYALSGTTIYPSSAVVTMTINHSETSNEYVHQGTFPTPQSRWGDFTTTLTDYGGNPNFYWSASQYMADSSHYGTVIAYGSA
jgi:hypothetical protein